MENLSENQSDTQIQFPQPHRKQLILIFLIIVLFFLTGGIILLAYQNYLLHQEIAILRSQEITEVPIESTASNRPEPSSMIKDPENCELGKLTCEYDNGKFSLKHEMSNNLTENGISTNKTLPYLSFKIKGEDEGADDVLRIFDLSSLGKTYSSLDQVMPYPGVLQSSKLRPVIVEGKQYSFTSRVLAEGFPTNDDGSCFNENGQVQDEFILSGIFGIEVSSKYEVRGCELQEMTSKSLIPDSQTTEEILKIIESISIQ